MTREYLEGLGLEKEVIDKIMAEHGKGIEKIKTTLSAKEAELETLQGQLKKANKEIEGFKELDIDEIQKKADKYKEDYEKMEIKAKKDLEALEFKYELEGMARDFKAKNIKSVLALIDKENLLESKNRKEDMEKAFESVAEENEFLFDIEGSQEGDKPTFTRPGGGGTPKKMTKEEFNELSYIERNEIFTKDKSLYDELTK